MGSTSSTKHKDRQKRQQRPPCALNRPDLKEETGRENNERDLNAQEHEANRKQEAAAVRGDGPHETRRLRRPPHREYPESQSGDANDGSLNHREKEENQKRERQQQGDRPTQRS